MPYLKLSRAMPVHFKIINDTGSGTLNDGLSVYMNILQSDFPTKEDVQVAQTNVKPQVWSTGDTTNIQIKTDSTHLMILGVYDSNDAMIYHDIFGDVVDSVYFRASVDWSDPAFTVGECYTLKIMRINTLALGSNLITDGDNGTMTTNITGFTTGNDNFAMHFPAAPCSGPAMSVTAGPAGTDSDRFLLSSPLTLITGGVYQLSAEVYVPSVTGIITTAQPKIQFEIQDEHPPQIVPVYSDSHVITQTDWQNTFDLCEGIDMTFVINNDTAGAIQIITDRIAGVVPGGSVYIDNVTLQRYTTVVIEAVSDLQMLISADHAETKTFLFTYGGSGLVHNINYTGGGMTCLFRLQTSECIFFEELPEMGTEHFRDSGGAMVPSNNTVQIIRKLKLVAVPWFYQYYLAYGLSHSTFVIDGAYYALKGDVKLQRQERTFFYDGVVELIFIADANTYSDASGNSDNYQYTQC